MAPAPAEECNRPACRVAITVLIFLPLARTHLFEQDHRLRCLSRSGHHHFATTAAASPMLEVTIRTWGSTSNLGPGFDVIGLALQLPLELRVHLRAAEDNNTSNDARSDREIELNYEHLGEGAGSVSSRVADNLILSTAATLARRFGRGARAESNRIESNHGLTRYQYQCVVMPWARVEKITVTNSIPLARGLGSSAAAIVAGCMLANQLCELEVPFNTSN